MSLLHRILFGRRVDEWAAQYTLAAAEALNQVAADLVIRAEDELTAASLTDGLLSPGAFVSTRIAPMVREAAEPVAQEIMDEANRALGEIVDAEAIWLRAPEHAEAPESLFAGAKDVAAAAAPLAAGVAGAAALPFAAVTTSSAFFGLITTTVISWPVVIGGGALAGLGIVTGIINTAKIRDRTTARLRQRTREFIRAALIEGTEKTPAVLEQLGQSFSAAADRARSL
jgi:hypothetical protein